MDTTELLENLRLRPRAFLLNDSYDTLVAFVMGFDAAFDGKPLRGFNDWCRDALSMSGSSIHWAPLIYEQCESGVNGAFVQAGNVDNQAKGALLDLLRRFLESKN